VRLPTRDFNHIVSIGARAWERRRHAVIVRRAREYGTGLTGLYSGIGPHRGLIGRSVTSLHPARLGPVRGSFVDGDDFGHVRRGSLLIPSQVAGSLRGGKRGAKRDLAVAVNGRIEAVGVSWYLTGDRSEHFALMVPEDTLHEGSNNVELYAVGRSGALRLLART
jgi:hypothetical protein